MHTNGKTTGGGGDGGGVGQQEPDSQLKGHLVLITGRFDGRSRANIDIGAKLDLVSAFSALNSTWSRSS